MEIKPNLEVMLVVFVVFLITMFLLNRFVFQPVISFMDKRDEKINNDLELATKDDKELAKIELQIHDILSKAKAEAYLLKDKQIQEAKDSANAKIQQIQSENKEKMESFMSKLIENKEQMKDEFRASLKDIDSLLAKKIKNIQ